MAPTLLALPTEIKHNIFKSILYTPHTIILDKYNSLLGYGEDFVPTSRLGKYYLHQPDAKLYSNPGGRGPLDRLAMTCRQMSDDIADWAELKHIYDGVLNARCFGFIHREYTRVMITLHAKYLNKSYIVVVSTVSQPRKHHTVFL